MHNNTNCKLWQINFCSIILLTCILIPLSTPLCSAFKRWRVGIILDGKILINCIVTVLYSLKKFVQWTKIWKISSLAYYCITSSINLIHAICYILVMRMILILFINMNALRIYRHRWKYEKKISLIIGAVKRSIFLCSRNESSNFPTENDVKKW